MRMYDILEAIVCIMVPESVHFSNRYVANLYYECIYQYIIYCNHMWVDTYKNFINNFTTQILQNEAVRIITGCPETITKPSINQIVSEIQTRLIFIIHNSWLILSIPKQLLCISIKVYEVYGCPNSQMISPIDGDHGQPELLYVHQWLHDDC